MPTNERKCPDCNAVVGEGSKFCPNCGAKVENQEAQPEPTRITIFCPNCGATIDADSMFCPECGNKIALPINDQENETNTEGKLPELGAGMSMPEYEAAVNMPANQTDSHMPENLSGQGMQNNQPYAGVVQNEPFVNKPENKESEKAKKKSPIAKILIGVSALAVVLIAVFAGFLFFRGGKKAENPYIMYVKDKELNLSHISSIKPYELTSKLLDDVDIDEYELFGSDYYMLLLSYSYVHFSDDNNYLFYPDKIGDGVTIYWRDLRKGKSGESHKIDSGDIVFTAINKNGSKFYYIKGSENRLYVYDRNKDEKTKLDDDVRTAYISDDGNYIIYIKNNDGEKVIYELQLSGKEPEKNKIDSEASIVRAFPNSKKVFYLKDDSLYVKENKEDKVKIASDVTHVVTVVDEKSVYYLKSESIKNSLDKFIEDDYAAGDKDLVEPVYPSYPDEPRYPNQYDYTYQQWYSSYWGYEYNEELDEWGYWNLEIDWDRYYEAVDQYKLDYEEWEKECNRIREEYYLAYELYEDKVMRDFLREELKDEANAISYNKYILYYWSDGTETELVRDVAYDNPSTGLLATSSKVPVAVYQKYNDNEIPTLKLSELIAENGYSSILIYSDVMNKLESARSKQEDVFIAYKDKEYKIAAHNATKWNISEDGTIYFIDEYDSGENSGILKTVKISGKGLESPVTVDKDVSDYYLFYGSKLIYCKDLKDGSGDIYQQGKKLASDVRFDSLYCLEDSDTLFYITDYDQSKNDGTLYCRRGDGQTKISDDVYQFVPVNEKNVVYLMDYNQDKRKGELVIYRGGQKRETIDTDVAYIFDFNY